MYSKLLVLVQFTAIGLLVGTVNRNPESPLFFTSLFLLFLGIFLGILSIFSMRASKLKIFPEVHDDAKLITKGIYTYVRHPMYLAVLVTSLGLLVTNTSLFRATVYFVLVIDLLLKIKHEESLLCDRFANYKEYKLKTKKLIPFLY